MAEIKHVGVLGMKWGIRRRGPASKDHSESREIKKKHVSELSNDELKKVVTRLQLEKQYKDISAASVGRGGRFVSEIIQRVGAQLVNNYARTQVDPGFVDAFQQARKNSKKSG